MLLYTVVLETRATWETWYNAQLSIEDRACSTLFDEMAAHRWL